MEQKEHLQSLYALEDYLTDCAKDYLQNEGIINIEDDELEVDDSAIQFACNIADSTCIYYSDIFRIIELFHFCGSDFTKYWDNAEELSCHDEGDLLSRMQSQAFYMVDEMARDCFYYVINDQKENATA